MPRVRVFLCTYRRPHLLRRALASLLAQTCTDWVCELHNDAPGDPAPRQVLDELAPGDARFVYHPHATNWGALATFNHAFAGGPESCASLLEDDNWWETDFLTRALATLEAHPEAALVWANMRIWHEEADGSWRDTGRTVWPGGATSGTTTAPATRAFRGPELLQAFDALHSQGAMVFRPARFRAGGKVPESTPLAIIEPARERIAEGSLVLLTEPLAHFAHTRSTARDADATRWLQAKLLLAASFFSQVRVSDELLARMWQVRRALRPRDTGVFFFVALLQRDLRLVRHAQARDWLHFLASNARHPRRFCAALRCRTALPAVWTWLKTHSRAAHLDAPATVLSKTTPLPSPP